MNLDGKITSCVSFVAVRVEDPFSAILYLIFVTAAIWAFIEIPNKGFYRSTRGDDQQTMVMVPTVEPTLQNISPQVTFRWDCNLFHS